jgi:hypothetical protein
LDEWQAVLCTFRPDTPIEFGALYVSMLEGRQYNYEPGPCCDAGPPPEAYPSGLLCRDLNAPPPGLPPDHYTPEAGRLIYGLKPSGRQLEASGSDDAAILAGDDDRGVAGYGAVQR